MQTVKLQYLDAQNILLEIYKLGRQLLKGN